MHRINNANIFASPDTCTKYNSPIVNLKNRINLLSDLLPVISFLNREQDRADIKTLSNRFVIINKPRCARLKERRVFVTISDRTQARFYATPLLCNENADAYSSANSYAILRMPGWIRVAGSLFMRAITTLLELIICRAAAIFALTSL